MLPSRLGRAPSKSTSICWRRTISSRALLMDDAKLEELAQSIKANGIIQPILVRRTGDTYRIIAGERRWRAAQRAGLLKVPVVVRDVPEGSETAAARAGARREPSARKPEPGRRGARVSAPGRRVRPDAGSDCRRRRQGPQLGRELPAAAASCRRKCAATSRRARSRWDTRARCWRSRMRRRSGRPPAKSSHDRCRCATPRRWSRSSPPPRHPRAENAPAGSDVHTRAAEDRMRFALGTKVRIVTARRRAARLRLISAPNPN